MLKIILEDIMFGVGASGWRIQVTSDSSEAVQTKANISRGLACRLTATCLKVQKIIMGKPSHKSKVALDSSRAFK